MRAPMTDYLIGADPKIPDGLTKIIFLVKMETAVRSDIKSRFGIMGFSTSDTILGLWVFFLTELKEERRQSKDRLIEKEATAVGLWGPGWKCSLEDAYVGMMGWGLHSACFVFALF